MLRVYPIYLNLLGDMAVRFGVHNDDVTALLSSIPAMERLERPTGPTTFQLIVNEEHGPVRSGVGKVFELVGPNARHKTTTLLYVALILGSDLEDKAPFLGDTARTMIERARDIRSSLSK